MTGRPRNRFHLIAFYIYWLLSLACAQIRISTPWGLIEGVQKTTSTGFNYSSFEGIPFGEPPVGPLRFAKPVPSTGSKTIPYLAHAVKPSCMGLGTPVPTNEDCLYLDLYVPHANVSEMGCNGHRRSVMVFIHGGGFIWGTGLNNAYALMQKGDVIVAFIHYRLGPLGFLSTGDAELKGNYGLWDQHLALKWVKDNVAAFGGDPDSITIFGQSAGSASVSFQALAPPSKDLFKRGILQSGSATSTWALQRNPMANTFDLAQRLGCGTVDDNGDFQPRTNLVNCLRLHSAESISTKAAEMWLTQPAVLKVGNFIFTPVVDGEFVMAEPRLLIRNQFFLHNLGIQHKDFFIGFMNNEGSLMSTYQGLPQPPDFADALSNDIIPMLIRQRYGLEPPPSAVDFVYNFYTAGLTKPVVSAAILQYEQLENISFKVANAFGDPAFVIPSFEFANAVSAAQTVFHGSGKSFLFFFDYCPTFVPHTICMGHGLDAAFLFPATEFPDPTDAKMSDMYVNFFATFAKTSRPSAEALVHPWPNYEAGSNYRFVRVAPTPTIHEDLWPLRKSVWFDHVFFQILRHKIASIG